MLWDWNFTIPMKKSAVRQRRTGFWSTLQSSISFVKTNIMELSEVINIVKDAKDTHTFLVYRESEKTEKKRLFVSQSGNLCEYAYRSRTKGYIIGDTDSWTKLEPLTTHSVQNFRKNLAMVVHYLVQSQFWRSIRLNLIKLQSLSDDEIKYLYELDYRDQQKYLTDRNITISIDQFLCLYYIRCIETVRYDKSLDTHEQLKKAIKENRNFSDRWTRYYDCSVEYKVSDNEKRAWYSEEYRGCANGYYYILLDDKHIAFKEKD